MLVEAWVILDSIFYFSIKIAHLFKRVVLRKLRQKEAENLHFSQLSNKLWINNSLNFSNKIRKNL